MRPRWAKSRHEDISVGFLAQILLFPLVISAAPGTGYVGLPARAVALETEPLPFDRAGRAAPTTIGNCLKDRAWKPDQRPARGEHRPDQRVPPVTTSEDIHSENGTGWAAYQLSSDFQAT